MLNLIVACCKTSDNKLGIGYKNQIPWYLPKELAYFKKITLNNVVVMGRKTFDSIGNKPLKDRVNIVVSNTLNPINYKDVTIVKNFEDLDKLLHNYINSKIYIIGGSQLYNYYINKVDNILLTIIAKNYVCDTYFPFISDDFIISDYSSINIEFNIKYCHIIYKKNNKLIDNSIDIIYNNIISKIYNFGNNRNDRTNTGTISLFGEQMKIDIREFAPLLTTKKIAWKSCIKELLWFLRGETDANILKSQNVNIWDGNSSRKFLDNRNLKNYKEGELGPLYGWQIRYSGANYPDTVGGIDQLDYIVNLLKTDPFSRRIMWNLWNPKDLDKMALTPCHYSFQLYVTMKKNKKYLSGIVTLRSNDMFLGNPFNIFSYYVLLRILCIKCEMEPFELILNIGDSHIYTNHLDQVKTQLNRSIRSKPILKINEDVKFKDWNEINVTDDFDLIGYFPHKSIHGKMAV